jgi:hypothetical protein
MILDPPIAIIETNDLNGQIYMPLVKNKDAGISVRKLSECGWFIRSMTKKKNSGTWTLRMEYNGAKACPRIKHYRFSFTMRQCLNKYCQGGGPITNCNPKGKEHQL